MGSWIFLVQKLGQIGCFIEPRSTLFIAIECYQIIEYGIDGSYESDDSITASLYQVVFDFGGYAFLAFRGIAKPQHNRLELFALLRGCFRHYDDMLGAIGGKWIEIVVEIVDLRGYVVRSLQVAVEPCCKVFVMTDDALVQLILCLLRDGGLAIGRLDE